MIYWLWNSGDDGRSIRYVAVPIDKDKALKWLRLCQHMQHLELHHRPEYREAPDELGSLEFRYYEDPSQPNIRGCVDDQRIEEGLGLYPDDLENKFVAATVEEVADAFTTSESFEFCCLHATNVGVWWEFTYLRKWKYETLDGKEIEREEYEYENQTELLRVEELRAYVNDEYHAVEPVRPTSEVTVTIEGEK